MKIVSWNVNGLLACMEKGGFFPIARMQPDIVCCQEVKTHQQPEVLPGYHHYWNPSQRQGYAGVLTMSLREPLSVRRGLGVPELDLEGRLLTLEFPAFFLLNAYFPNSQDGPHRRAYRGAWDAAFFDFVQGLGQEKPVVVCGDFNATRSAIDIFPGNTRLMEAEAGYMSEERAALEKLLASGFVDVYRHINPGQAGAYTWWSHRFHKRDRDDGWRLDYFLVSRKIIKKITSITHHEEILGSDHCPIGLDIHLSWQATQPYEKGQIRQKRPQIDFPDEYLAALWEQTDWDAAEENLANLQRELAQAASHRDMEKITALQKRLVRLPVCKFLAVRRVCAGNSGPGLDGVKWKTAADKARAALLLNSDGYRAQPLRNIKVHSKSTGRDRMMGLPTFFDRAMQVLYGFSLLPVLEAWGDKKSFAFRGGRSMQGCHAYILQALQGRDAPELVLLADVQAYYAHVQHRWLMEHTPMDKKVLGEFLRAGYVFAGELFPEEESGLSLGSNISPALGNLVLDGLQAYIYKEMYGSGPVDYKNGGLVRFADDILITAQTEQDAAQILTIVAGFLSQRGLALSREKTKVVSVQDGFDFMSHNYQKRDGWIYTAPSRSAIDRCKGGLYELITTHKRSQRELIESINRKLTGWATHHRYTDARAAFAEIDEYVDKLLHQSAYSKHSRMAPKNVDSRYWFQTSAGASYYALPNSRHIHVKHLADVPIVEAYEKLDVRKNPYADGEYFRQRHDRQATEKMTGKYRTVWKRQQGRCYYCGRPIRTDQPRTVVPVDLEQGPLVSNLAYIHTACNANELQVREVLGDIMVYSPRELLEAVQEIKTVGQPEPGRKTKGAIGDRWIHMPLKRWFAQQKAASITLTFAELEKIDHRPLAPSARNSRANWYTRPDKNAMAEAWVTEGYKIFRLSLEKEKVTFHRVLEGASHVKLPGWLKEGKIPDGAAAEIEGFLAYIKGKYGL